MPTDAERIAAIRRQTLDLIAEITAQPKPTYDIDGQKISWGEYLGQLQKTVQWCNQQAAASCADGNAVARIYVKRKKKG